MTRALTYGRDPLVGTSIDGRYKVSGVLGRGGMGVVYEGVHEQLGRAVAIKVLGPGIAGNPTAVQRFLREARTASQLTHGNIVDVSDLGALPDGRPYLVMPRLQGTDLSVLLEREGPQTLRRTIELLRGAAAALDLVHAKGYVHRDFKLENLMHVVRADGSEAVLLLDFGIVGLVAPDGARLTAEGSVFGTPAYIAPELIRGDPPTARADIYALATVAFELMTGRAPFIGDNVMQLLQRKLSQDAPSMGEAAGFSFPPAVETVVARSLSRDPDARHASAGAFIAALVAANVEPRDEPPTLECGLDGAARARLQQGTAELELSFGRSVALAADGRHDSAAPLAADGRHDSAAPPDATAVPKRPLRALIALAALVALALMLWWSTRGMPAPSAAPQPEAAASAPVLPEPLAPSPSPQPPRAAPAPAKPATPASPSTAAVAVTPAPLKAATKTRSRPKPTPRQRATPAVQRAPTHEAPAPASPGLSAPALVSAAQDELVQGHLAAALKLYAQATQLDSRNAAALRGLGLVHERLGHTAAALRALRRAIASSPDDPNNALLQAHIEKLETTH